MREPVNVEQEIALGLFEFLKVTEERFRLHPVLHMGWSSLAREDAGQDAGWISTMRPDRYVEVHLRFHGQRLEAEIHHMRTKDFDQVAHAANSSYDYGVRANVCRCGVCRERYPNPYADASVEDEDLVDLTAPDSFETIRRLILKRRW